nr:glycine betaine ABC transporter substrate-binding protein [uncultured Sphaerochaeta sp.]
MRKYQKLLIILMLLILVLSGCSKDKDTVVLASKPVTEQFILAEMLTVLIETHTDLAVEQKLGIGGGTSNIHPALLKGEIDLYPEYTGTGWLFVLKEDPITDANTLYERVKTAYDTEMDLHWSGLYGFNNTYGVAVAKEVAEQYGLKTVSDLAKVSGELTFAANPDFLERDDGFPGLVTTYGLSFGDIKEIDIGLRYEAVKSEGVDVITVFSTDGRLQSEPVVVLEDDASYFTSYHAATIIRNETLEKYPELEAVLERLSGKISNAEMIEMNYLVEIEKKDPKQVAKDFLTKKGLL